MSKVVKFYESGAADVLKIEHELLDQPAEGEARIAVRAIGLNRYETMFRQGDYAYSPEFPSRLGGEAVGIVEAVGPNTNAVRVGDRVTVLLTASMSQSGVYAEKANVPVTSLVKSVEGTEDIDEAALWLACITAYGPLIEYEDLQPGQTVLITAASSSVGTAAIQIVKDRGGIAIATTRTQKKKDKLIEIGADYAIATEAENLGDRIEQITNKRGVDIAFDAVGGNLLPDVVQATAEGGRIYEYGVLDAGGVSKGRIDLPAFMLFSKTIGFYSVYEIALNPERFARADAWLRESVKRGAIKPIVDTTFALDRIVDAHQYMEAGNQIGKIVVLP